MVAKLTVWVSNEIGRGLMRVGGSSAFDQAW
jgi:hypothetical protein